MRLAVAGCESSRGRWIDRSGLNPIQGHASSIFPSPPTQGILRLIADESPFFGDLARGLAFTLEDSPGIVKRERTG